MKPRSEADVVVIGAGPAGSITSAIIARGGRRVMLVDRATFPRTKACGDGLAHTCFAPLAELGLASRLEAETVFCTGGMRVQLSDGSVLSPRIRLNEPFVRMIPRHRLDQTLLDHALEQGVDFREDCRAGHVERRGQEGFRIHLEGRLREVLQAPIVVVATGVGLPFASGVSLDAIAGPRVLAVRAYYDDVDGLTDAVEFLTDGRVLPGYYWVFPTGRRTANIGVASYVPGLDLPSELAWFLGRHPRGRALGRVKRRGPLEGGVIPVLSKGGSRVCDGVMLVGDAGWFCDPLMFHGLGPSMGSGALAARVVLDVLDRGLDGGEMNEALRAYDGAWKREFGTNSLFLAMSLLRGVDPLGGETTGAVGLRGDASVQYEALLRMFAQAD